MKDLTICIPSKDEDPRHVKEIKRIAKCPVIVVKDKLYGEAIKECVRKAKTKYVLTMDSDGQHTIGEAVKLYKAFKLLDVDMLVGTRTHKGRYFLRSIISTFLNVLACCFAWRWVTDLNSGMRIFRRDLALQYENILCDDFSYTTSILMSFLADGYKVEWFPIKVMNRQGGDSHIRPWHLFETIRQIFRIGGALRTRTIRRHLRGLWNEGNSYKPN